MPKKLLRYALSRLELLEAEALDMDNLDFALGRNTIFEFRDVGIKVKVGLLAADGVWEMRAVADDDMNRNSQRCSNSRRRLIYKKPRSCFFESRFRWTFIRAL